MFRTILGFLLVASLPHFYAIPHDSVALYTTLYFQGPSSGFVPFREGKMGM